VSNLDGHSAGGLAFWGVDYNNYYAAQIFLNGTFSINRLVGGTWAAIVPRATSEAIKKGTGAVNDLQVVLNNDRGSFYINGSQVGEFRDQVPQVGGAMGLFAVSEIEQVNDWRFLNITIVQNQ
jgi:hypothetical protein